MTIGGNIKKYREKKGLTQKELGAALGLAEITIRQYENNKREPKYERLYVIADVLSVSVSDLMNIDTGKQIKEARIKAKLTQEKLAQKAGISVFTLQKYESGDRNPKIESLQKIANALGISITQLKSM
ncbi:helix-turn-helix domain-containing protein [Enterocloster bolteae]|uniref:helix-turn-helix domain-containing protein n=1 Tax=Enterocloster bolteae TaxID=208479 RepID=UPI00204EF443|nr:helix-turn-helix transcriptional regulator [Enterocloster bolteae]DAL64412.1 MAG TPA_asm: Repressor protein CI [Caudoviricetes sp.]